MKNLSYQEKTRSSIHDTPPFSCLRDPSAFRFSPFFCGNTGNDTSPFFDAAAEKKVMNQKRALLFGNRLCSLSQFLEKPSFFRKDL